DGGAGAVQALGVQLLDKKGKEIPVGGAGLGKLSRIDISKIDKRIFESEIIIACDVKNPLTGKKGATFVYAEQKGASRGEVKILEKNMIHFVDIIKKDLKINVEKIHGSGAAGGLGAGLMVFLKAKLEPGFEIVKRYTNLEEKINDANLVITGEGEMDFQTEFGKAPLEVAKIAKTRKIPVIAIVGNLNKISNKYDNYFKKIFSLTSNKISKIEAMRNAENYLIEISEEAARYWKKTHPSPLL
ncbi:MAG TPA: glycerate kinase, partial [Candidatus Cloacimonetes bacterium]|nr:glycerate kinase [Candidatus Cloacimonadota bacterium]